MAITTGYYVLLFSIIIAGKAEYVQCESEGGDQCTGSAITIQVGQNATLDATLNFEHGGASMHNQTVQLLHLSMEAQPSSTNGPTTLYVCSLEGSDQDSSYFCLNALDDSVAIKQGSSDKFDISLVVQNDEVGVFLLTITYEVVNPRTGGQVSLVKVFQIEVEEEDSEGKGTVHVYYLKYLPLPS